MKTIFMTMLLIQISHQQLILPEHKRRHCQALLTSDVMEQAVPEIRRIIEAESAKLHRQYEAILATLRGSDNWQKTRENCQGRESYLAEIRSEEENNFVKSEAQRIRRTVHPTSFRSYFLGGTDKAWEGNWKWIRTGERIEYTDWTLTEPNNMLGAENCLMMFGERGFTWNDANCYESRYGICKKSVGHNSYP